MNSSTISYAFGKVAIGTSDPGQELVTIEDDVDRGDSRTLLLLHNTNTGSLASTGLGIKTGDFRMNLTSTSENYTGIPGLDRTGVISAETGNGLAFYTLKDQGKIRFYTSHNGTSIFERMRIDHLGHIGIGTQSPQTYLHIHGNQVPQTGQFILSSPSGQDIQYSFLENNVVKAYLWWDAGEGDLRLQNNSIHDLNLNPYGGNVGIGTNSPTELLEVNGNLKVNGEIIVAGSGELATQPGFVNIDKHYAGELYGGGIVFYVYENGAHGLIASLSDIDGGSGIVWGGYGIDISAGNGAESGWDGKSNTEAIVSQLGNGSYAARICYDYVSDSYDDWYLPSPYELNVLYNQAWMINTILENDGDPETSGLEFNPPVAFQYWSSYEQNATEGWKSYFFEGSQFDNNKNNASRVRAVRAF